MATADREAWRRALSDDGNRRREAVVIGSGPGGSVAAARLQAAGLDTLVLETGGYVAQDSVPPFSAQEMALKYRHRGMTVALGGSVSYVEGCCVGGASEVNSGLYHRAPEKTMAKWAEMGGPPDLADGGLDRYSEEIEKLLGVNADEPMDDGAKFLAKAADKGGAKWRQVPKWVTLRDGVRERNSMTRTLLSSYVDSGGKVLAGCRARHLEKAGDGWKVHCTLAGGLRTEIHCKYVLVCAGATGTPRLLAKSGLAAGAGKDLLMHPMMRLVAEFDDDLEIREDSVGSCQAQTGDPVATFGCAASGRAHVAAMLAGNTAALHAFHANPQRFAAYYSTISCGTGSVPSWLQVVRLELSTAERATLWKSLAQLAAMLLDAGATRVWPVVRGAGSWTTSDQARKDAANAPGKNSTKVAAVHLMSSCPMGTGGRAVLGPNGEVGGDANIRVADASAFCGSLGVNPQGTVMAIAARNTDAFLEEHGK